MPATPPQGATTQPPRRVQGRGAGAASPGPTRWPVGPALAEPEGAPGAQEPPLAPLCPHWAKRDRSSRRGPARPAGTGGKRGKKGVWGKRGERGGGLRDGGRLEQPRQGPRHGRRGHMQQPPEVVQRSQARQGRDPYMYIER